VPRPGSPRAFAEFRAWFATAEACWRCLLASRWRDGFRCPRCGPGAAYSLASRALLQCRACRHQTSVTAGTVLHRSRLPLTSWFAAAYRVTTHTPGFSALQLQRQLGLGRRETAFVMLQKLRRPMRRPERDRLGGILAAATDSAGNIQAEAMRRRQTPMAAFQSLLGRASQHQPTTYKILYAAELTG